MAIGLVLLSGLGQRAMERLAGWLGFECEPNSATTHGTKLPMATERNGTVIDVEAMDPSASQRITSYLDEQVELRRVAGLSLAVVRRGQLAYRHFAGVVNVDTQQPIAADTIFRIYSMTKPITSTAIMMLYERGLLDLDEPVSKYIPAFADVQMATGHRPDGTIETAPCPTPITIHHLLTHTAGLSYWFLTDEHGVSKQYRDNNIVFAYVDHGDETGGTLLEAVNRLAQLPLVYEPGTQWLYSNATDVLGCVVEVISGQRLGQFFQENIFAPLKMHDTGFFVPAASRHRFAACYRVSGAPTMVPSAFGTVPVAPFARLNNDAYYSSDPKVHAGGGGLVSTLPDYTRFVNMLLNYGSLNGQRILGRKTVQHMTRNQLQGDLGDYGQPRFLGANRLGTGFGYGFAVVVDPAKVRAIVSRGECSWGGMASTAFWIDFQEQTACILMTQLVPSSTYPFRRDLRALVNSALL